MNHTNTSSFILHVSDFHLTSDEEELKYAFAALEKLSDKLISEHIQVDYLLHTGDVIESGDLYEKAASKLNRDDDFCRDDGSGNKKFDSKLLKEKVTAAERDLFNRELKELTEERFRKAEDIMRKFASRLNVSLGNVVICCGNHDVLRPLLDSDDSVSCVSGEASNPEYPYGDEVNRTFEPFENFLDHLETANSRKRNKGTEPVMRLSLGNLNILLVNTNWRKPKGVKPGYYCVNCSQIQEAIKSMDGHSPDMLNMIMVHKPIYEICEIARLSHKRYMKTRFMADLQEFVGEKGIYLCGDKHTRSIVDSFFHDIPHYIGGEPLTNKNNSSGDCEVEYNLLKAAGAKLGMERKIHLRNAGGGEWECDLRPQDNVVSELYKCSKDGLVRNVLEIMAMPKILHKWENVGQEIYSWKTEERRQWYQNLDKLYKAICKYRKNGWDEVSWESGEGKDNIFVFICKQLKGHIGQHMDEKNPRNILNIRGEYSSGKSTFLGILYIYLLHEYSIGAINFIPAYYNLENEKVLKKIKSDNITYHDAVKRVFEDFTEHVQEIAVKEHQSVCYIIDGLDEQDCWSYSSEDSIGRGLLDILSKYRDICYIMAFSQHRLPCFKNTMPPRTFNDTSDIIYFNPIDVREDGAKDNRFVSFVKAFLELNNPPGQHLRDRKSGCSAAKRELRPIASELLPGVYDIIRNFRRLTINPGFMYDHCAYITAADEGTSRLLHVNRSVDEIYRYYIDQQYEICIKSLGYGFIHYAPAMAYLFSYYGYTYERFKRLPVDYTSRDEMIIKPICENHDKIYDTFLFIKKHNDAREYLIALYYNKELRYYAEHPYADIAGNSILNEYIVRNIAVLIRKMWSDTNKFIIVCEKLLERKDLSNCVLSMLIYILEFQEMYPPFKSRLRDKMLKKGEEAFSKQPAENQSGQEEEWEIRGESEEEKLRQFINLSLRHTMQMFSLKKKRKLIELFMYNQSFCQYNRQHQMLYYGDLSICGEDRKHHLHPGHDIVYKGFDFHNCFNYLYGKLSSDEPYPLREFDMCTMWDLIYSRLTVPQLTGSGLQESTKEKKDISTFFYRDRNEIKEKANSVLKKAFKIFDDYTRENTRENGDGEIVYFDFIRGLLKAILDNRNKEKTPRPEKGSIEKELSVQEAAGTKVVTDGPEEAGAEEEADRPEEISRLEAAGTKVVTDGPEEAGAEEEADRSEEKSVQEAAGTKEMTGIQEEQINQILGNLHDKDIWKAFLKAGEGKEISDLNKFHEIIQRRRAEG